MSLIEHENNSVTIGKERRRLCMECAWEIGALANTLPGLSTNTNEDDTNYGLVVRGFAGRFVELSNVLCAALSDTLEETSNMSHKVYIGKTND